MTKISMKALFAAGSLAVVAAISLSPAAHAQGQPGTMTAPPPPPGPMNTMGQPGPMAPVPQPSGYGYAPQQNSYIPPAATSGPSELIQANPRYPGPKIN